MIFGRPVNLWLGLTTAALAFVQVTIVTVLPDVDPTAVATVLGAAGLLLGAVITLVANQPPTVNSGDTVTVVTPKGQPNETVTV
jgi:hypothetical protein